MSRLSQHMAFWAMVCVVGAASGCGGGADRLEVIPVEGVVSLGGEPLPGAKVSVFPETPAKGMLSAVGVADGQGKFKLTAGSYVGLPVGKYKVAVSHYTMKDGSPLKSDSPGMDVSQLVFSGKVKQAIPRKYSDVESTQLRMEVAAGKTTGYDIAMEKK